MVPRLWYRYVMRLLCLLTVTLVATTASAEPTALPFDVVNVLPNTKQVLIFDRAHNTHVLLTAGSDFESYVVVEINGIGVTMEHLQERFTVYPRAAQGLALHLEADKSRPPAIYSVVEPTPAPAPTLVAIADRSVAEFRVAEAAVAAEADARIAVELASLLSIPMDSRSRGRSGWMSPLKP
jgi:hypothetical protein